MGKLRPLSVWEWLVCGLGMFFMGLGIGYISLQVHGKKGTGYFF